MKRSLSIPQFGPLLVGLLYGLTAHVPQGLALGDLYWQSPLFFTVLSGLALAYACRPVLMRIRWTRPAAFVVGLALLVGIGPLGEWIAAAIGEALGVMSLPLSLPRWPLAPALAALVAAGLMAVLYRPPHGEFGLGWLGRRLGDPRTLVRLERLPLLAAWAVAVVLALAALDAYREAVATGYTVPLVYPNPWLRLQGVYERELVPSGLLGATLLLALLWLRALLAVVPLLPIALVLRATWPQLTLVFTLLLFVLGEFGPLMLDQPYPSAGWLALRVGVGLARSALVGAAAAALLGRLRPSQS